MDATPDEVLLIRSLARDAGVPDDIPEGPQDRWTLIRALMNVRPPLPVSADVLAAQDRYLSAIVAGRGVVDADSLMFRDGVCLWKGDITRLRCDAIVNAANSGMLGCFAPCHGCIDNAIHSYAGMQLRAECQRIMGGTREPTGSARITGAYNLPCSHVIHTVGPIIHGDVTARDEDLLRSCYRSCLSLARDNGLHTVAFCCISTGEFRFPNRMAAEIAVDEVRLFLSHNDGMRVVFDVFKDEDLSIYRELLGCRGDAEVLARGG